MIASSVPVPRWPFLLLISAAALTAWRAWPVAGAAEAAAEGPVTYHHVPLLGIPLEDAILEASGYWDHGNWGREDLPLEAPAGPVQTCLPFLAPILEYPGWQLRITRGVSGCFGDVVHESFAIASTGDVTWTSPGLPARRLALSSEQLALVRRLDRLSCVTLQPREGESGWVSIGLDLGRHQEYGGARISPASTLGRTVTAMLDELMAQYRGPRREAIGSMDLRLATTERNPRYRVRVSGGRLTVERGRKLLVDEPVEPDLLVDLVDAALEPREVDAPEARGVLLLHGRSVPVSLDRHERGPFAELLRAIARAYIFDVQSRDLERRPH